MFPVGAQRTRMAGQGYWCHPEAYLTLHQAKRMGAACVHAMTLVSLIAHPFLTDFWSSWGIFLQYRMQVCSDGQFTKGFTLHHASSYRELDLI